MHVRMKAFFTLLKKYNIKHNDFPDDAEYLCKRGNWCLRELKEIFKITDEFNDCFKIEHRYRMDYITNVQHTINKMQLELDDKFND